jgi:hypothetical protein
MKRNNARSLAAIAADLNKLDRKTVFDRGDLLLEARAQCEPGGWLDWLETEVEYSEDSAEKYMKVSKLASGRFRNLRNLRLGKTTLYALAYHKPEDDLPAIIKELAKRATSARLRADDAEAIIEIVVARRRFGDHPDATLVRLMQLDGRHHAPWYEKACTALREQEPESDEDADAIVEKVRDEYYADPDDVDAEAEQEEADAILDGDPPILPPPTAPSEPQKLGTDTEWAETGVFAGAVMDLLHLRGKPAKRFVGKFTTTELREVRDLLSTVENEQEKSNTEPAHARTESG